MSNKKVLYNDREYKFYLDEQGDFNIESNQDVRQRYCYLGEHFDVPIMLYLISIIKGKKAENAQLQAQNAELTQKLEAARGFLKELHSCCKSEKSGGKPRTRQKKPLNSLGRGRGWKCQNCIN